MNPLTKKLVGYSLLAGGTAIATGLYVSPTLQSLGAGMYLVPLLFSSLRQALSPKKFLFWLGFPLLYVLHAISLLYTENLSQGFVELRIKLPFLFLPFGVGAAWLLMEEKYKTWIEKTFILTTTVIMIGTLMRYLSCTQTYNALFQEGKYVPVVGGLSHIYFGILVCVAIFWAWESDFSLRWRLGIIGILVLGLHLLALRTGMMIFYLVAAYKVVLYTLRKKNPYILIGFLALCGVSTQLPPIRRRIQHTLQDLRIYQSRDHVESTSLGRRLLSYQAAWKAFQKHPLFGTGMGDNSAAMNEAYETLAYRLESEFRILPHNQWLEYMVGLGLVGVMVFTLSYVGLWWQVGGLGAVVLGIFFLGMQGEALLERQAGVIAFCFLGSWAWRKSLHLT